MKLSTLRATTAVLAIVPGWEIGKALMSHAGQASSHLELEAQVIGSLALGYGIAYVLIGIVASQFRK
jgi:ribosome biogenesis protein Tsr3